MGRATVQGHQRKGNAGEHWGLGGSDQCFAYVQRKEGEEQETPLKKRMWPRGKKKKRDQRKIGHDGGN